jgi:hypothetical protein
MSSTSESTAASRAEARAISASTAVNLSLVVALLAGTWRFSAWGARLENKIDHSIELLENKIDLTRDELANAAHSRWRREEMLLYHERLTQWAEVFRAANPSLAFPPFPTLDGH